MKILLLTAILFLAASAWAAPARTTEFALDFEECPVSEAFGSSRDGMDVSYVGPGSLHRVIETSMGKVLLARKTDLRYWGMNYTGKAFYFSADVMPGERFGDAEFRYAFSSHWSQLGRPGRPEETVFSVKADRDGEPALFNYKDEKVCSLERNAISSIEAAFDYGSYHYTLTVNGKPAGGPNEFDDDLYQVTGLNIYVFSRSEGSSLVLDNIRAETLRSVPLPQRNSFQKPGPLPKVALPAKKDTEDAVFVNDMLCGKSLFAAGRLWIPRKALEAAGAKISGGKNGALRIKTDKGTFESPRDTDAPLSHRVTEKGVYFPAKAFGEAASAKVWRSDALKTTLVSTGKYRNDGILRSIGGHLWMNGEPYYEISFNKWDIFHQIYYDASLHGGEYPSSSWNSPSNTLQGAERALRELSENGFRSIRFFVGAFNPGRSKEEADLYFRASDMLYDLCDKYHIRLVPSLSLVGTEFMAGKYTEYGEWVSAGENYSEIYTEKKSKSLDAVLDFIDAYVGRYKDRDTVLMWEISNEGNLNADVGYGNGKRYSLLQMSRFYSRVIRRIKQNDPERLVTGGDSMSRSAQWHLLTGIMEGRSWDWTVDSPEERLRALWLINRDADVVSMHAYNLGADMNDGMNVYAPDPADRSRKELLDWDYLLGEAARLYKPLYIGEAGGAFLNGKVTDAPNRSPEKAAGRAEYLRGLVDAGVQLTHWWAFNSDRADFNFDLDDWTVTIKDTPETFEAVKEANRSLQEKYLKNDLR
ncbi:MAG: cellulase family glycosylhydrolase [Abditibacteriota bacterium]|nr:cellulase family glycosylhydrolase [Abditibacteriota bacterium]